MAQKRAHSPPPAQLYLSTPIFDRSSTFRAVYSPTLSSRALQSLPSLATATHRIAAWRVPSKQSTLDGKIMKSGSINSIQLHDAGHDSDGERGAGRRLEKVLADEGVEGCIVVGRWYGGIMLGPVRFSHIESVAREAIRTARTENPAAMKRARILSPRPSTPPKRPGDDDAKKRELLGVLKERDGNISVLRQLLEDKRSRLEGRDSAAITPSKLLNYPKMPLPALKALEKVRDATVAFLLKELDKVDDAQKAEDELNAAFLQAEQSQQLVESEKKRKLEEEEDEDAWRNLDAAKDQT